MVEEIQKIAGKSVFDAFAELNSSKLTNSQFMAYVSSDIEF
jgi:hypothetical protein